MTLRKELENLAVPVKIHNISYSEMSKVITDTMRAGVIAIGTPTYDAYPFPRIWAFVNEMEGKRFAKRPIGLFGTFGWAGGGVRRLHDKFEDMKFEILEPVIDVHGRPTSQELEDCKSLARAIAAKIRNP